MKVQLTESAFKDLENTFLYYQEKGVPEQGRRLVKAILHKTERLAKFPESGRMVPEFSVPFLREIIMPPYRIVYWSSPKGLWIIRIWRSEQLLMDKLRALRGKLYIEDNWEKFRSMEIQEKRAAYGKRPR